jgi:Glyoxalase-like domain
MLAVANDHERVLILEKESQTKQWWTTMVLIVADPDAAVDRAVAAGATVVVPMRDE